jgi:hypothetical protein
MAFKAQSLTSIVAPSWRTPCAIAASVLPQLVSIDGCPTLDGMHLAETWVLVIGYAYQVYINLNVHTLGNSVQL